MIGRVLRSLLFSLAVTIVVVVALALVADASAQGQTSISIDPTSGPCDQIVVVVGEGYAPQTEVEVYVGPAESSGIKRNSVMVTTDSEGRFQTSLIAFPGCSPSAATRDLAFVAVGLSSSGEPERAIAVLTVTPTAIDLPSVGSGYQQDHPGWQLAALLVSISLALTAAIALWRRQAGRNMT